MSLKRGRYRGAQRLGQRLELMHGVDVMGEQKTHLSAWTKQPLVKRVKKRRAQRKAAKH